MGRRCVVLVAAPLVLGACITSPAPGSSSNQASVLMVAFKEGDSYRYHYSSRLEGTITVGQSPQVPIKAEASADATWKIVSVDANGYSTVDLTLSNLKTSFTGSFPPGSTSTTTTTTTTQQSQFKVAHAGEIVSCGGPSVATSTLLPVPGLGPPCTDQFLATLPGHPVKPGDTWTKTFTRPNLFDQSSVTYTTQNRFLRYENLKSGRAAVIETTAEVPVDVTIDLGKLAPGTGAASSPSPSAFVVMPAGGQIHLQGTSTTVSTTWLDANTDKVEKVVTVDTIDMTTSLTGVSFPSPLPLPSGLLPASPGQVPPGLLGLQHFSGRQTLEFDLLS